MLIDVSHDPAGEVATDALACGEMKTQYMLYWLKQQGATFPAMEIEIGKYGREARASARIKDGEPVMEIPPPLMITPERARTSGLGKRIAASTAKLSDHACLAAYLLELKHEGGFWKPYLDVLPADFAEHRFYFSDAEAAWLEGSYLMPDMRLRRAWAEYEFFHIRPLMSGDITLEEYLWARAAIMTRVHKVMIAGKPSQVLAPLADMPNHAVDANMCWRRDASLGFCYIATRDIEAGEPLTISYGTRDNGHWFYTYGFCLDNNPYNHAEIDLPELPAGHPFAEQANHIGSSKRGGRRIFEARASYNSAGTQGMFSYLRLYVMSDALDVMPVKNVHGHTQVPPASIENEQAVLRELALACRRRLQAFPTSIDEDVALLKDQALPLKLRNAMRVRHGEKVVLEYLLDLALTAMPMRAPERSAEKHSAYFKHIGPLLAKAAE